MMFRFWHQHRSGGRRRRPTYTLRHALPLGLLVVVIAMLFLSYLDTVVNGRISLLEHARADAVLDAEHLARITQRELKVRRNNVASDLAVAATEPRIAVMALINPQGRIEMAQRLGWRGLRATEVLPHFSPKAFARTVKGRVPDVQELSELDRIVVMVPFVVEGRAGVIRDEDRGVVYLEYDLTDELAMLSWDAQRRMWPLLLVTLLITFLLARLLRSRVTQPLARVEQASLLLARQNEYPQALPETGPREVAGLAHSFNAMALRIREAQHDSETSRARLAGIVEAAMDAIITVDARHRIRVINRAALRMFECDEHEVLGEPIELLIPSQLRASNSGFLELHAPDAEDEFPAGRHSVVRGRRLRGAVFPAEASVSRIAIDGAQWVTIMLRDVTERMKAEEAIVALNNSLEQQVEQRTARLRETTLILEEQQRILQAAHAEQRTIFETLTVGIALLKDGVIVRSNRRLEEIFGYGPEHLLGRAIRVWYPDDDSHAGTQAEMLQVTAQGQVYQRDRELVRADGTCFWARMTGRQLVDANPGSAVLLVIEDMTLQRAAEQAIHDASEKAREASRAKSNFLANMSHEIRTPMNAIIGLSYQVLRSDLPAQQHEQVRKIQRSSQVLLAIINDILDYSKIEAGKLGVEAIEFPLEKVLDNVASIVADKAGAKGLELQFQVDPDVPARLVGDALRLSQILVNYTDNAIKFTQQGRICVHISLREESASGVLLHGAVTDSGRGLSEDQIARLFQSFQQADSSITREFGGTGLGLAICKQLAGLMQGEVGVQSQQGIGSTFWFTARLGKARQAALLEEAAVPAPAEPPEGFVLPQVAGLDVAHGLRQAHGNQPLYLSLLRKFVQGQASVPADLRAALYIGHRDEAQRIAHGLKSLADTVGAVGIQHSAADLEVAIRGGQSLQMLEVSVGSLERQLAPVIAQLRAGLPWQEPFRADLAPDPGVLGAVSRRLAWLLAQDNLEAVDWFVENGALFQRVFGEAYERMEAEVRSFNCQGALALLTKAAQNGAIAIDLGDTGEQP